MQLDLIPPNAIEHVNPLLRTVNRNLLELYPSLLQLPMTGKYSCRVGMKVL